MTIECKVIRKFSGNYRILYQGTTSTILPALTPAPDPVDIKADAIRIIDQAIDQVDRRIDRIKGTRRALESVCKEISDHYQVVPAAGSMAPAPAPFKKQALPGTPEYEDIYRKLAEVSKITGIGHVDGMDSTPADPPKINDDGILPPPIPGEWGEADIPAMDIEPRAGEKYTILTIRSKADLLYRGKRLPYRESDYPIYLVTTLEGRIVNSHFFDPEKRELKIKIFTDPGEALRAAKTLPGKVKALAKAAALAAAPTSTPADRESIRIPSQGTAEHWRTYATGLYQALKGTAESAYGAIGGGLFPLAILKKLARLCSGESFEVITIPGLEVTRHNDKKEYKTIVPALRIHHADSTTTIYGIPESPDGLQAPVYALAVG